MPRYSGGPSEVVTQADAVAGDLSYDNVWTEALPGGRGVLIPESNVLCNSREGIQALDLAIDEVKDLTPGQTPRYWASGHLLFMDAKRSGTL